jgi:amidase
MCLPSQLRRFEELPIDGPSEELKTMSDERVHAFGDDFLADYDAVRLAELVRMREVSPSELVEAAIARAEKVNPILQAIELPLFDEARKQAMRSEMESGLFAGVPSFIKDNTDIAGQPTRHGARAVPALPAKEDGTFARQFLSMGFILLGKTRLPEFGLNCSTEYEELAPAVNPWNTDYSCGGSSGGAAALVAAGVVPVAHANDGGGSIRIPAACCGLVGLKVSRGRFVTHEMAKSLPVNVVSDGIVSRTVRDTAHFVASAERYWRNPKLPEVGLVEGPGGKRLRIGLLTESLIGPPCPETLATLERTVQLLESLGHAVVPMTIKPVNASFANDFVDYWGLLAWMTGALGKRKFGDQFDPEKLDGFTQGLAARFRVRGWRIPLALYRLQGTERLYAKRVRGLDAILTPVLGHVTPPLGFISPDVPFEELLSRLKAYAAYTPLNNANGTPAIALPMGLSSQGLPIGIQLASAIGHERMLLELAYELEQANPWPRIQSHSIGDRPEDRKDKESRITCG